MAGMYERVKWSFASIAIDKWYHEVQENSTIIVCFTSKGAWYTTREKPRCFNYTNALRRTGLSLQAR